MKYGENDTNMTSVYQMIGFHGLAMKRSNSSASFISSHWLDEDSSKNGRSISLKRGGGLRGLQIIECVYYSSFDAIRHWLTSYRICYSLFFLQQLHDHSLYLTLRRWNSLDIRRPDSIPSNRLPNLNIKNWWVAKQGNFIGIIHLLCSTSSLRWNSNFLRSSLIPLPVDLSTASFRHQWR